MQSLQQQFLTWCRSKPADEEYDYCSNTSIVRWAVLENRFHTQLIARPRTFGALADRLEAALS